MHQRQPVYQEQYFQDRESWPDFRTEAEALLRLSRLPGDGHALEVGCGGGELLLRVAARCRVAVGLDLSREGLAVARRKAGLRVLMARAEELPMASGSFDALLAQHLIEHLPDPVAALREWRRVLRPGGMVALATPNAAHPDPSIFYDPSHTRLFTAPILRLAMEEAGFRVVHLSALFPFLGPGRLARSASIRLAGLAALPGLSSVGRTLVAAGVAE